MQITRICLALSFFALTCFAVAQDTDMAKMAPKKTGPSDAGYTAKALAAAPKAIAKEAGVARFDKDGSMKTLRESKNGFTCMVIMGDAMCADANSMAFFGAMMKKETPPDKLGLTYMLSGDNGASNTDPTAEKKTADNHWVVTGPHIMIVGAGAKSLGLSETADADPTKPYMMWAGTPYEHAMIPVADPKPKAKTATTAKP
jgi:uncharacterized protein YgiM (DUF1202 family)